MDIQHRTLFLCLFLASWVAVFSQQHSKDIGITCCKGKVMKNQLEEKKFRLLKNYAHLPSHGRCPEYLEFVTFGAEVFCISAEKAQEMKEFVDQRRKGTTPKDTPFMGSQHGAKQQTEPGKGTPRPTPSPASASTSPRGYKEPPTSSSSTTALPVIHGQDRTSTLPSKPPSPASTPTGPRGHTEPPPFSSSTTALPGLHWQERTSTLPSKPPSPASTPTGPQRHTEPPPFSSSTTALPGLHGQERTSTLPSKPPSPASTPTGPRGHTEPPPFSSSTTALPGLHGQERTSTLPSKPPSPASTPTGPQRHTEPPPSSSSTTALPGLHGQERTSTLQSTPRKSTRVQLVQHEDVTTRTRTKETYGTSLHPRNTAATILASPPNKHKAGEDRTTGVTDSHSSTRTGRGEADEATGVDQRLQLGLLAAALTLLVTAAVSLVGVKFKRTPAVVVEGVRYHRIHCTPSETVGGAIGGGTVEQED